MKRYTYILNVLFINVLTGSFLLFTNMFKMLKLNKSVYIVKSRQRYHLKLNDILLHVSNRALKDMYILNYGTFLKIASIIVPSRC